MTITAVTTTSPSTPAAISSLTVIILQVSNSIPRPGDRGLGSLILAL